MSWAELIRELQGLLDGFEAPCANDESSRALLRRAQLFECQAEVTYTAGSPSAPDAHSLSRWGSSQLHPSALLLVRTF